ncbi:hypothetical protein BU26DRAFT_522349 [Trematosphaeria pertusa]|uniref:DUF7924 domain-containing protein n=1 Tax=Trematosphaeria pertusa TaxID=390896 RepID=A0A6A6I408_9PLEO|nr:uncharacterized protein BU26DRAFT_522349 [Trematosphaeria pertusa]KAF2245255.1 hypothetical protein BU26DRAFT_522349 [Trematosphaeria pertusa]
MDGPSQSTKRRLDTSLETPSLPAAKRARLFETNLQQPAPKRPRASFLEDHVGLTDRISGWLESIGSDREKRCRSDSYLHASSDDPIPRNRTRSAPQMAYNRDADGYAMPPTPNSYAGSFAPSIAPSGDAGATPGSSRSSRALVEDPFYRDQNLAANGIYMRYRDEPFPEHIASVVDTARKKRDSPGPSPDDVYRDRALGALEMEGLDEPDVEDYFRDRVFPKAGEENDLRRTYRQPMSRHAVPSSAKPKLRVSNPIPDMLYGYRRHHAFPDQQTQLISMGTEMNGTANTQGLMYPFFVIEFKGNGGDLWVATNQCLGGSASCVNIAERLNDQLRKCKSSKVQPVDSTVFSIAMNGEVARLYVSWKHNELDYYMQKVRSFLLQDPEHYIEFRKHVKNIIDWGRDKRLTEIRESLNTLLEAAGQSASEAAKARPPPRTSSASDSKRHCPSDPGYYE